MEIRCIAVDDEKPARIQMEEYIKKVPLLKFLGVFKGGLEAMAFLKENKVDLIFLDIQMDDLTGIEFLESLNNKPKVVFTTAYDSYALDAYELDVVDYLLKPISFKRFVKSVDKVYETIQGKRKQPVVNEPTIERGKDYIFVRSEYKLKKILLDDILHVEGFKEYLRIYTSKGEKIYTLMTFKSMEEQLPAKKFIRCHKSYIVSVDKIESIEKNRIYIGETIIPIGDSYRQLFYDELGLSNQS